MKVLTIISKLEMGGIEKTLLSCLPYLKEKGVEMTILCTLGGALDNDYIKNGAKLIDFGNHKKPFKDAVLLKKILKEQKFDLVHSRYGHTSGQFAKVCKELGVPLLISLHNERAMFRNNWIGKPILGLLRSKYLDYHKKLSIKYATRIIGHSKANLKYFTPQVDNLPQGGLYTVLYNGVDFSKFTKFPALPADKQQILDKFVKEAKQVFIHVGSFKEQKNHHFLIEVFNQLNPKENNYRLILLGVGSYMEAIKQKVNQLGLENHVLFVGMETNIAPYLYAADLFIFPSLYEGFGNVLIEAQYVKLPIAPSDIDPHHEASFEGYKQFFYNPLKVEEATTKIKAILKNENTTLIEEGYQFANQFSVENMVNNLYTIYKEVKVK